MNTHTYYFHCHVAHSSVRLERHLAAPIQFKAHKTETRKQYLLHSTFSDPVIKHFHIRILNTFYRVYEFCCHSVGFVNSIVPGSNSELLMEIQWPVCLLPVMTCYRKWRMGKSEEGVVGLKLEGNAEYNSK